MSQIGSLGSTIIFKVSANKVLTFNSFSQNVSANYNDHSVINGKPLSEFAGAALRSISLAIRLDATMRVNPRTTMTQIEKAIESGKTMDFVLGGKKVGNNKWVIQSMSENWDCVFAKGRLIKASVTLNLKEYVESQGISGKKTDTIPVTSASASLALPMATVLNVPSIGNNVGYLSASTNSKSAGVPDF